MSNVTRDSLNNLLARLVNDAAFRQDLLVQPETALQQAGYSQELTTPEVKGYLICSKTCDLTCDSTCKKTS